MLCDFVQVETRDGVNLEGLVFTPPGKVETVVVWIHGLTSNFHRNHKRITTLAQAFNKAGLAYATFDTRGHDVVSFSHKFDKRKKSGERSVTIGTSYERFEDCVLDLDVIVDHLKTRFKNVVLVGHSTGANKVAYYLTKKRTRKKVDGAVLVSPVSDVSGWKKGLGDKYEDTLDLAREMIKSRKGENLMPFDLIKTIYSAQRFLSLANQKSREQMFPTREFRGPLRIFSKIKTPTFIVFGESDDYLVENKVSAKVLLDAFTKYSKSKNLETEVIPGADHSFIDKEEELGKVLLNWILRL